MRRYVSAALAVGLLLAGCGSDPAPQAAAPASSSDAASSAPPSSSSAPMTDDISAACNAFKEAIDATASTTNGKADGEFSKGLVAGVGGKVNEFGMQIWLSLYSKPYLPASTPDSIRTPIESFGEIAAGIEDAEGDTQAGAQIRSALKAYYDASEQCQSAGSPLA